MLSLWLCLLPDGVTFSEVFQEWSSIFNLVMISDDLLSQKDNDIIMDKEKSSICLIFQNCSPSLQKYLVLYGHC